MLFEQIISSGNVVEKILAKRYFELQFIHDIVICFSGNIDLHLSAINDTDELAISIDAVDTSEYVDLSIDMPAITAIYGMSPLWSWEMVNNQGYLDALQIEFVGDSLTVEFILQLKVIASSIYVYRVERIKN